MKKLRPVSRVQCCAPRSVCLSVCFSVLMVSLCPPTAHQSTGKLECDSKSEPHPHPQGPRNPRQGLSPAPDRASWDESAGPKRPHSVPSPVPHPILHCQTPAHCLLVPQPLNDYHTLPSPLRTYITDLLALRTKLTPLRSPFLSQLIKHLVPSSVPM